MRRVALLIETSTSWGKGIIAGVQSYCRSHERWQLTVEPRGKLESLSLPYRWSGHGVVARVTSSRLAAELRAVGVPCVNVSQVRVPGSPAVQVTTDESAVGRLAAEHVRALGVEHVAYYGPPHRQHYVDGVADALAAELQRARPGVATLRLVDRFDPDRLVASAEVGHDVFPRLMRWIAELPKPCAVLAWDCVGARLVADACAELGLAVPGEVPILAADHDEFAAHLAEPPLSCVDHDPEAVGHAAAQTLHRLMDGYPLPEPAPLIQPAGIRAAASTDALALRDPAVADALRFIRQNLHKPIQVRHLTAGIPLSRRALEVRFRTVLGRSPAAEIRRARLERVRQLLAETNLPVATIARRCGFLHSEVLQRTFRAAYEQTPTQFRQDVQQRREQQAPRTPRLPVARST